MKSQVVQFVEEKDTYQGNLRRMKVIANGSIIIEKGIKRNRKSIGSLIQIK